MRYILAFLSVTWAWVQKLSLRANEGREEKKKKGKKNNKKKNPENEGTFSRSHASLTDDGRRDVDEQTAARSGMGELLQCVWTHMEPDVSHVDHTGKKRSKI